jgi:hypothetical protein
VWLIAWNDLDLHATAACLTDHAIWEDPSMFGVHGNGRAKFRT